MVVVALVGLTAGAFYTVNKANADTDISDVYQYYLLANSSGQTPKVSSSDSSSSGSSGGIAKGISGLLGNGGNQGTFSYQDIISGATDEASAKKFSTIMATLSSYSFISVKSNGVSSWLSIVGRGIAGFLLMIIGLFVDLFTLIQVGIVNFIAQYNPYTLLAGIWGQTAAAQDIASAFGLSTSDLKMWSSTFLVIFTIVIIWTLVAMMRRGDIDSSKTKKFWGRLVGFVTMPLVIIGVCELLGTASSMATNGQAGQPDFANWIMDVETWAERDRFDTGIAFSGVSISAKPDEGKYVDTNFNPYAGKTSSNGNSYAAKVGQNLYAEGDIKASGTWFPNATLALNYATSGSIDPSDYLSSVMTTDLPGYRKNFPNKVIYDFKGDYYAAGGNTLSGGAGQTGDAKGIGKASADYETTDPKSNGFKTTQNWKKTWIDRYIYGAKHSGALSTYYKQGPSAEQVYSNAGGGDGDKLTYESTYFVLNTKFNSQGGSFSLDGPTWGAYSTISKFDSNRYYYYKYSMVGNPAFTIPAMISQGMIKALITLAIVVTMFSVGIVDMFVRPFRAWIKSSTFGDIEYTYAQLAYGAGLLGTIAALDVLPSVIYDIFNFAISFVSKMVTGNFGTSAQAATDATSSEMAGFAYIISGGLAIVAWIAYVKNWGGMRDKVTEVMVIPWVWAKDKGQQLEDMVADSSAKNAMTNAKQHLQGQRNHRNESLKDIAGGRTRLGAALNKVTGGQSGKLATSALRGLNQIGGYGNVGEPQRGDGLRTKQEMNADEIRRIGANGRIGNAIRTLSDAEMPSAPQIQKDFDEHAEEALQADKLTNPNGTFDSNNPYLTKEDAGRMQEVNEQTFGDLSPDEQDELRQLQDKQADGELNQEEADRLRELENKAAEKNTRLRGARTIDGLEKAGARNTAGRLSPEEVEQLNAGNEMLEQSLGADDASRYKDLVTKQAQGTITSAEQQQLKQLRNKAVDPSGKYEELLNKQAKGEPLTANEQKQLDGFNQKANELAQRDQLQTKGTALGRGQQEQLSELQGLHRAEMTQVPLTNEESKTLRDLNMKRQNAVRDQMKPQQLARLNKLENLERPMNPKEKAEFDKLQGEANKLGNLGLSDSERKQFEALNSKSHPTMTDGQRKQYQKLSSRARQGLTGEQQREFNQARRSINQATNKLKRDQAQIVKDVQSKSHIAQAVEQRKETTQAIANQQRQVTENYQRFQQNGSARNAANLANSLNELNQTLDSHNSTAQQRKAAAQTSSKVLGELNNYAFAPGNASTGAPGAPEPGMPGEGPQPGGYYNQIERNTSKDSRDLKRALQGLKDTSSKLDATSKK